MSRYIGALRGPQGQTVQLSTRVGSFSAPLGYWDEPTILDNYTVSYDGQSIPLYVDTYHFSLPKAPAGFTCGGPLVAMLGFPPLDPLRTNANILAYGIEEGTAHEISPIPLDLTVRRGDFLDQFTMVALLARAAAASGAPLDPDKPAPGMAPAVFNVVAFPVACGDRMIAPQAIEMATNQGPLPRNGDFVRGDDALRNIFPGLAIPAGSIAARLRQGLVSQTTITYAEPCEGNSPTVVLPFNVEPPRLQATPAAMPPGISEPDPTVYLQVILDTEGRFARPHHIGGPKSLVPTAIETIGTWRAEPVRLNGKPVINPMVLQVIFRQ
jgi:hypothetical protein